MKKKLIIVLSTIVAVGMLFYGCGSDSPSVEVEPLSLEEAIAVDKEIIKIVNVSETTNRLLMEGMSLVDGGGSLLDLYDLAKLAKTNQFNAYSALSNIGHEESKDYVSKSTNYVITGQLLSEGLIKYIDKNEMKYLSDVKSYIESLSGDMIKVAASRVQFLGEYMSLDEIEEYLSTQEEQ